MPPATTGVIMAQSVKLSDNIMTYVRKESNLQSRSVAGQVTHWINIGRAIEKSGSFDFKHVNNALQAALSPDELTPEEQEVWFEQFKAEMTEPTDEEVAFFAKRRKLGRGVGMSDSGELVYQKTSDE